ncbi:MAG TPA: hypothetical protein VGD78_03850 [Chthoniobacterales bacterium]
MKAGEVTANRQSQFIERSRQTLDRFLTGLDPAGPIAVLCHSDADGLAAGAILVRALRRNGRAAHGVATGKAGSAWSPETLAFLRKEVPQAVGLVVCDLGVRSRPVWPGMATLLLDHHYPAGLPDADGTLVITGYDQQPIPTSGLIAYWAVTPPGEALFDPGPDSLGWIAALSLLSDLGDKAPFPLLSIEKKRWGASHLREATTLLNAPRRSSSGDPSPAFQLLLRCDHPRQIGDGASPESQALFAAKEEVDAAYNLAKRAAPKFSGPVAMVRIHTPCQVHPLIAQIWRSRLPKYLVFAANTGYRAGWVHFSARSRPGTNLLEFLREHRPAGADPELYGNGHDQAAGGALPFAIWNDFVQHLGFGLEVQVVEPEPNEGVNVP